MPEGRKDKPEGKTEKKDRTEEKKTDERASAAFAGFCSLQKGVYDREEILLKKPRQYPAIDVAKYICALLVVAIHTFPFLDISPSFNLFFISTVCRIAVPFFFVSSSFFLFRKLNRKEKTPAENQEVIKTYLKRLGILYLAWTVIYIPYTIWNYAEAGFSWLGLLGWIRDFFLNGSYYHLWFLPALMLGVVIVWHLYEKKGIVYALEVALGLYLAGYLINIYAPFWESLAGVKVVYGFFTKTLVTARDGIFFAPIFVVIGAAAARLRRPALKASAIGFAVSFLCLILEVTLYAALGVLNDKSCMFLSLIPALYFLFNMLLKVKIPNKPVYRSMRQDSTLIYVSHILFARVLLIMLPSVHLVVYLGTLACAQVFSSTIIRLSDRYKWLKWLM